MLGISARPIESSFRLAHPGYDLAHCKCEKPHFADVVGVDLDLCPVVDNLAIRPLDGFAQRRDMRTTRIEYYHRSGLLVPSMAERRSPTAGNRHATERRYRNDRRYDAKVGIGTNGEVAR